MGSVRATLDASARGLGQGAAASAPTAPHATPRDGKGARTGPEWFWAKWPARTVFAVSLVLSAAAHVSLAPWKMPPSVQINDYEGEATVPIDILEQEDPAAEIEPPAPAAPPEPKTEEPKGTPAGETPDAGKAHEAAASEASADAEVEDSDAASDGRADDGRNEEDAEGGRGTDGAARDAAADDGGAEGRPDPEALLAASDAVPAEVVYVTVALNAIAIRENPAAVELGGILRSIPQWNDFMRGTEDLIDPVRDADWIYISGPSLRDTSADVITLHYNVPDATVDKAVAIVARQYPRGGSYDTGVRGVRAWLIKADRAERVIERPRSHLLVIVPPRSARGVAKLLVHAKDKPKNILPGVAVWVRLVDPHHALPGFVPEGVLEMRLKVSTRSDGGADITIDGDCRDEETAERAAEAVRRTIRENNTFVVSMGTAGLLNHPEVTSDGQKLHVRVRATRDQVEATIAAIQFVLPSVTSPPPAGPSNGR